MSKLTAAIIGASGGLGSAFVDLLSKDESNRVFAFSRSAVTSDRTNVQSMPINFDDESTIQEAADFAGDSGMLDLVIVATGMLHDKTMMPEKSLRDLSAENFQQSFSTNIIGPALVAKHFLPQLRHDRPAVFAALSARVGSISDNRLGGWYAYRASKAALNMVIKTASIEASRRNRHAIVVGLHPGTVATGLSEPFQKNLPKDKLFTPEFSAQSLLNVITQLQPRDTGKVFAWDGAEVLP